MEKATNYEGMGKERRLCLHVGKDMEERTLDSDNIKIKDVSRRNSPRNHVISALSSAERLCRRWKRIVRVGYAT